MMHLFFVIIKLIIIYEMKYRILPLLIVMSMLSCTSTQKVNTGEMAFEFKQYHKAIQLLKEEVGKTSRRDEAARKSFLIAVSYERLNDVPGALLWYQRSYEKGYGDQALFKYAQMLKRDGQYESSIKILNSLVRSERANLEYRKELTMTRQAMEWVRSEVKEYDIDLLGLNSSHTDYQPQISPEGVLYFTSDRRSSTGDELYHWTGQKFMDVFQLLLSDLENEPQLTTLPINSENHESTPAFHKEGRDLVFCRCADINLQYDNYCLLYHAVRSEGRWKSIELLPFMEKGVNYMHPVFSNDGNTLYFASDNSEGYGKYDIWTVDFKEGVWGIPVNLGPRINTEGQEAFPTIDKDTLYFSSDFRSGLGGLDIFKSYYSDFLGWIPPSHLPHPINSGGDDMSYTKLTANGHDVNEGLFVSSRQGGQGADDIYRFTKYPIPKDTTEDKPSGLKLEVTVKGEIYTEFGNPNSKVVDKKPLENAQIRKILEGNVAQFSTGENGTYTFDILPGKEYLFFAAAEGYLNKSANFSSVGLEIPERNSKTYLLDIILSPKITNTEIVLENIYYDFDKADIRPDAAKVLDSLATLFLDNPSLQIELGSHTDCRGEASYNFDLSQRRAEAAVNYLIKRGINPDRLEAKGYGESKPAVDCECENCTEEEYQRNRRTTFKIME